MIYAKSMKPSITDWNQVILVDLSNKQIEQLMLAWQQSSGLIQADDILQGLRYSSTQRQVSMN